MFESFSRSWQITKLVVYVIKKDRELIIFPLLAGIFSAMFIIAMIFPAVISLILTSNNDAMAELLSYPLIFLIYLGLSIIATFFNVCVVYTAKKRFEGGDAKFLETLGFAFSKFHLILAWGLISATIGLILQILDNIAEKSGLLGKIILKIVIAILGASWSLLTVFVVPGMVYDNLGPFAAIRNSVDTFRRTWGENLIRQYGLGLVELLFIIFGVIAGFGLFVLAAMLGLIAIIVMILVIGLYFLGVILFFNLANGIFSTALYSYAKTGKIPEGYDNELLGNAFKKAA